MAAKRGTQKNTYQHTTIGGVDPDTGEDATNPVTYMVLETVVKVIRESSDSNDVLIRYGGDEFVLLSANADEQEFYRKLHHIRHKIHNAPVPGYSGIHLSVSIGGVYCENTLLDEAMHRADVLMYQAKNKKNAVIISEADSVADKESKQEILIVDDSEMNRAILAEMLGDSYIIHEAVNGEEARERTECGKRHPSP